MTVRGLRKRVLPAVIAVGCVLFFTACTLFGDPNQKDVDDATAVLDAYMSDVDTLSKEYVRSVVGDGMPAEVVSAYENVAEVLSGAFDYEVIDAKQIGDKMELTLLMENRDLGALMGDAAIKNAGKLVAVLSSAGEFVLARSETLSMFADSVQDCLQSEEYETVQKEVKVVLEKVSDSWVVSEGTDAIMNFVTGDIGDYLDTAMNDLVAVLAQQN